MLLGSLGLYAQTGIGTNLPHSTSALEIASTDKGLLIPRITLLNETDTITVTGGNYPESLLIYHQGNANLIAGFYYWEKNKWNAIVSNNTLYYYLKEKAAPNSVTITEDNGDYIFTWKDDKNQTHTMTISEVIKKFETLTTLSSNNDANGANLVYTPERGAVSTIDIKKLLENSTEFENYIKGLITGEVKIPKEDLTTDGIIVVGEATSTTQKSASSILSATKLSIKNESITSLQIADSAIGNEKIADKAVDISKIADGAPSTILTTTDKGVPQWESKTSLVAGRANLTTDGVIVVGDELSSNTIAPNSVLLPTKLSIKNRSITGRKIDGRTITGGHIAENTVGNVNITPYAITIDKIGVGGYKQVLTTDDKGVPQWEPRTNIIPQASNGLTKITENSIELGGDLTKPTIITTSDTNTLAIKGLSKGDVNQHNVIMLDGNGVLKQARSAVPSFFYMPPINVDVVPSALNQSVDTYSIYKNQFTTPVISNSGTGVPVFNVNELNYVVIYADTKVFKNVKISNTGILTYDIASDAVPTEDTFFTVVLQVK